MSFWGRQPRSLFFCFTTQASGSTNEAHLNDVHTWPAARTPSHKKKKIMFWKQRTNSADEARMTLLKKCKHKELMIIWYSRDLSRIFSAFQWNLTPFSKIRFHAMADRPMSSFLRLETVIHLLKDVQMANERTAVISPSENDSSIFVCSVFPVAQDNRMRIDCHAKEKRGERD